MSWKRLSALAAALALTGAFAGQALAQRDDDDDRSRWVELGERKVKMSNEIDSFTIRGNDDRGFRRLFLKAERGEVRVFKVRLVYKNRHEEDYDIDTNLEEGRDVEIKLRGERKYLDEVKFIYRAKRSFDDTIVRLYGVPSQRGREEGLPQIWIDLGCREVARDRVDRDVISVGRREGGFKRIRLFGRGADVHILDLNVVYDNGARDDIAVREVLREGNRTRPLDLRGRERKIERVELTYERINGRATVCAEGQR